MSFGTTPRTARKTHYCATCDSYRIRSGDRYLEGVVPPKAEPFCVVRGLRDPLRPRRIGGCGMSERSAVETITGEEASRA